MNGFVQLQIHLFRDRDDPHIKHMIFHIGLKIEIMPQCHMYEETYALIISQIFVWDTQNGI
jgi:hypothetical protein